MRGWGIARRRSKEKPNIDLNPYLALARPTGMKVAFVAVALLATLQLSPARANDFPADVSVKGDYSKVTMFLGDRLRQKGALAENCRQEARDWAKAIEADEKSKSSTPPSEVPFFGRRYDISSIVGNNRYVSIIRMSATEMDDVYSATETTTFLWDLKTNKRVS